MQVLGKDLAYTRYQTLFERLLKDAFSLLDSVIWFNILAWERLKSCKYNEALHCICMKELDMSHITDFQVSMMKLFQANCYHYLVSCSSVITFRLDRVT